jgi:ribosomal protein S18 acetylase RimI-like enzyme
MSVTIRPVDETEKTQFWDLLQEYLGEDGGRVFAAPKNQDGSYSYPNFDTIAGLVMVRKLTDDLYSIAEFYIRPPARRTGVGRNAVSSVFETFPDKSWLISVIRQNKSAFEFWLNIAEHSTVPIELEIIEKRRFRWIELLPNF